MRPEERLDALLALGRGNWQRQADELQESGRNGHESLQPLLDAADRVAQLRWVEPASDFTARLERQFFVRVEEAQQRQSAGMGRLTTPAGAPLGDIFRLWRGHVSWRRTSRMARLLSSAAAAVLLFALATTVFIAAAAAAPGTPLYGVHRFEQGVQLSLAGSADDRTRLHLDYAQQALSALDATTVSHQSGAAYDDALATFGDEMRAAATSLDGVGAGTDRDALSAQLDQLRAQGRADLHNALAFLAWPDRVVTTSVLADIGDNVLHVSRVTMVYSDDEQHLWRITVTGSGFAPGAVLLVDGQPAGKIISRTPTTLVGQMTGNDSGPRPGAIGVANPDDTAAETSSINSGEQENHGQPGARTTPDGDDPTSTSHG
ncbi:MAG: hypothetical protein C5B60_00430 [Chloroflexi bacterium]|nr:MAG: hypothetical protein C5B60_00430 [Chloroflexota bacterium]